ncbi:failed axon connections protein [Aphelenchoides avenae]|nr:failed axon connections protein [Aphelenchus avenae]
MRTLPDAYGLRTASVAESELLRSCVENLMNMQQEIRQSHVAYRTRGSSSTTLRPPNVAVFKGPFYDQILLVSELRKRDNVRVVDAELKRVQQCYWSRLVEPCDIIDRMLAIAHRYLNQLLTEAATISSLFILVGTQTDVLLESAHYCHARTSLVTLPLPDWKTRHRIMSEQIPPGLATAFLSVTEGYGLVDLRNFVDLYKSGHSYIEHSMPKDHLLVKDWEKDLVYLVQIPRAGSVPSLSPFCLKLETWLRMADVRYQNVDNGFKHKSVKGQLPYIEFNGLHMADSNHIIEELTRIFHVQLDSHLTEREAADARAYHSLIEDSLRWQCWYFRALNNKFFTTEEGVGQHFTGWKKFYFKTIEVHRMRKHLRDKCIAQGVGRDTPAEVEAATKKNLKALSVFLDDKKYLMGGKPSSLDATAFGHLCQFYYCPMNKDVKNYMDQECRNLVDYLRNMRDEFWPDWNEAVTKLSLATRPNKSGSHDSSLTLAHGRGHHEKPVTRHERQANMMESVT